MWNSFLIKVLIKLMFEQCTKPNRVISDQCVNVQSASVSIHVHRPTGVCVPRETNF